MPVRRGAGAVVRHQVGAVDARRLALAERAQRPHERHAVGHRHRARTAGIVSGSSRATMTRCTAAALRQTRAARGG